MQTEINRLIVSSKEGIIYPTPVSVPRRQTLDFHPELFPPVPDAEPAVSASDWLAGSNEVQHVVPIDPKGPAYTSAKQAKQGPVSQSETEVKSTITHHDPKTAMNSSPSSSEPLNTFTSARQQEIPASQAPQYASPSPPASVNAAPVSSEPSEQRKPAEMVSRSTLAASTDNKSILQTHWSRSFLIGKTPLKPTFEGLSGLGSVAPPEQPMLRCNPCFLVFPLDGAGGRIAAHPLKKVGRLPAVIPAFVCGANLSALELDPFDHQRIYVACDDSKIRMFEVPEDGLVEDSSECEKYLTGKLSLLPCTRQWSRYAFGRCTYGQGNTVEGASFR